MTSGAIATGRTQAWGAVLLLTLCYVVSLVDRLVLGLLVEPIRETLSLSDFEISLLQGPAFATLYAVMGVPLGRLADTTNRRNLVVAAIAFWSVATMGCGLATSFVVLLVARASVGVGEAALSPAAYSMFADLFDKNRLGRAISVFSIGGIAGAGLSLLLGGAVFGTFSQAGGLTIGAISLEPWQATFVSLGAPGLIMALLVLTLVREPARAASAAGDDASVGAVWAHVRANGRFYFCAFALHAIAGGALYAFYSWAPSYLIREFELGPAIVGPAFGLVAIAAGIVGPLAAGQLADMWHGRFGSAAPLRVMGAVGALLALVCLVAFNAPTFALALVGCGSVALLTSALLGLPPIALQLATPGRMRGQISGFSLMVANLIGMGGAPVVVASLSQFVLPGQSLGVSIAIVIGCLSVGAVIFGALAKSREASS